MCVCMYACKSVDGPVDKDNLGWRMLECALLGTRMYLTTCAAVILTCTMGLCGAGGPREGDEGVHLQAKGQ